MSHNEMNIHATYVENQTGRRCKASDMHVGENVKQMTLTAGRKAQTVDKLIIESVER